MPFQHHRAQGGSDARYYLGSDYPYILKDETLNSVLEMIDYAKASFGGAEWQRGLEIMKSVRQRCEPAQIESEIRAHYLYGNCAKHLASPLACKGQNAEGPAQR
jgi:hypothetical protein